MNPLLAIDPGTTKSGWCILDRSYVVASGIDSNESVLARVYDWQAGPLGIEMIASYGMPVGREVFETVLWTGRFMQAYQYPKTVKLIYRRDVKLHLCGSAKAKDANIRQALLDRFPATGGGKTPQIGTKRNPGPLFGVSSHAWAALAVAVTIDDEMKLMEAA
jgi:hypothetical protein